MMQKIKYPVGSMLYTEELGKMRLVDVSKNEFIAFLIKDGELEYGWYSQEQLDMCEFSLVSSPRWIPEFNETYWTISDQTIWPVSTHWSSDATDNFRLKMDWVCKTKEECQKKIDEINSREI